MSTNPNPGGFLPLSALQRGAAARFENIGDRIVGKILTVERQQQRDYESGIGKEWPNGDPVLQTVVVLDTDSGEQTLYARGGTGKQPEPAIGEGVGMEMAIVTAVRTAGSKGITAGDELAVVHTGVGKPARAGLNGMKLYLAQYRPAPASSVPIDLFTS